MNSQPAVRVLLAQQCCDSSTPSKVRSRAGWRLFLPAGPIVSDWPERHFPGHAAPMECDRLAWLAAQGYEPATPDERWEWQEEVTDDEPFFHNHPPRLYFLGSLNVRRITAGQRDSDGVVDDGQDAADQPARMQI